MDNERTLNTVAIVLILTLSVACIIYLAYIMMH